MSVLMYETCEEADASDGPTSLPVPPNSDTAPVPPLSAMVKYGLLICLGRKAIFRPFLIAALGLAAPADEAWPPCGLTSSLVVPPQPAATRVSAATDAVSVAMAVWPWRRRRAGGEKKPLMRLESLLC